MNIIVEKETKVLQDIFDKFRFGDEKIECEKNCLIVLEDGVDDRGYYMENFKLYENVNVPKEVEPYKYCYDGKEFAPNPNWQEPNKYGIPDETLNEILDDHNAMLIEGGIL